MEKSNKVVKNIIAEENVLNWSLVQEGFKKTFGTEIYSSWLSNVSLIKEYNDLRYKFFL